MSIFGLFLSKNGVLMEVTEKIRVLREVRQWSQEQMAEQMNISLNAYSRIERGETKMSLEKLEQIANIFNINVLDLIKTSEQGLFFLINENSTHSSNYYGNADAMSIENEKLKLENEYLKKSITQQEREIVNLNTIIDLLKKDLAENEQSGNIE